MKYPQPDSFEHADFERTDTMPLPVLADNDTGTLAMPSIAARPVDAADLAESLREREQLLEQIGRRASELEDALEAAERRCAGLQRECDDLRAAQRRPAAFAPPVPVSPPAAPAAPVAPAAMAAPGAAAGNLQRELVVLRQQNTALHEALSTVHGQIAVREALLADAEEALRRTQPPRPAARDSAAAAMDWQARSAELFAALETERAAAATQAAAQAQRLAQIEAELVAARTRATESPALESAAMVAAELALRPAAPRPLGSVMRVLVRDEGGAEVVYPLGRHTSIGRTPDNDIQVNTTFVSRHHAVLLAGTDHCIVEDLNSTNGILVNGHRAVRQVLNDGDIVTIGKTHFRYQQRS